MSVVLWNWILAFATVFALALFIVSLRAYLRTRTRRFALLMGAFAFFAMKSLTLSWAVNVLGDRPGLFLAAQGADVAILGLFYLGVQA